MEPGFRGLPLTIGSNPTSGWAGATLGLRRHLCGFFNRPDDQYRVLLPFIKDGFECGDKAVHIIDPRRREEHVRRLRSVGIDTDATQQTGQLEIREWTDAHLRGGVFDPDRTRGMIHDIRQHSQQQGFPHVRFVTHMEWALEARTSVDALLEYEASANLASAAAAEALRTRFSGAFACGSDRKMD
jgi:hypothetical protein